MAKRKWILISFGLMILGFSYFLVNALLQYGLSSNPIVLAIGAFEVALAFAACKIPAIKRRKIAALATLICLAVGFAPLVLSYSRLGFATDLFGLTFTTIGLVQAFRRPKEAGDSMVEYTSKGMVLMVMSFVGIGIMIFLILFGLTAILPGLMRK